MCILVILDVLVYFGDYFGHFLIFEFISVILGYWCYFGHFRSVWIAFMIP